MNILFFLSDLDGGGAQRTMVNIVNGIGDYGINATLVVARSGGAAQKWLGSHVRLVDLKVSRTLHALPGLRAELIRLKPNILMATMVDANIIATIAALGLKNSTKVILRETNSHRARGDIKGLRRGLIKWSYRHADAVVALSSGVRDELAEDYSLDMEKIFTIGNPVDIESIFNAAVKARQGLPPFIRDGNPVIVAAGRLTRQKGFDILIKAFAKIKTPARLAILGEGPDREKLLALAQAENVTDRLIMPGFIANPTAWLCQSDAFILSSRWEGFGHVIVEAMAAGIPVIATNCPYGPADIISHGKNGVLVEEGNIHELSVAIEDILVNKDKAVRLSNFASESMRKFSTAEILNKYISLFSAVLSIDKN